MLSRKSILIHPRGERLETPLLVPSFSSKGFLFQGKKERLVSEVNDFMKLTSDVLSQTMLVSAFDISENLIEGLNRISRIARVTFIDSGGYEVADYHDLSAVLRHPPPPGAEDWNEAKLSDVLDKWPKKRAAVIVSFDHRGSTLRKQASLARKLFARYPDQMTDFLIKPEKRTDRVIEWPPILTNIEEVNQFDIIGVTEKELGNSVLERMLAVARLREHLDNNSIPAPIHVFGSLDPLSSCLYFLAGAEIFDGLTWLRYGYVAGSAVYHHNRAVVNYGIHETDDVVLTRSLRDNLYYMTRLQHQMQNFLPRQDFRQFEFYRKEIIQAFETFQAKRGGK
jgi:hypothetical protein